jgi:hypothetical protein
LLTKFPMLSHFSKPVKRKLPNLIGLAFSLANH